VPWTAKNSDEPLSIEVNYDRTRLSEGDFASVTATIKNHLSKTANMVMVDLGIPPGFALLSEDFDDYRIKSRGRKNGRLEKFNLTGTQATLYFNSMGAGETIALRYRLRAKYPIRTRTFQSRIYEYYDPEVKSFAGPSNGNPKALRHSSEGKPGTILNGATSERNCRRGSKPRG